MTQQEIQQELGAELTRRSQACERGEIVAVLDPERTLFSTGLVISGPNCMMVVMVISDDFGLEMVQN